MLPIMSIVNGISEPADGAEQSATSSLSETYANVKKYICALPRPFGDMLSEHAHCAAHEDVPDDEVQAPQDVIVRVDGVIQSSIPPDDPKVPLRLRPTLPPINYGTVVKGSIYRSGYPAAENFKFLKGLGLKTIITLVPEPISPAYKLFMEEHGIQHFQVHIPANKGQIRIQACDMSRALEIVLNRNNHPILIHCNKGKHRTGCVVGCFRRAQAKDSEEIFQEYHDYADLKARILDEAFIEQFNENTVLWMARKYGWIASTTDITPPSPVSATSFDLSYST